jgi:hypothetical protein
MFFDKSDYLKLNSFQKKYLSEIKKMTPTLPFKPWQNRAVVNMEGMFACGWTKNNLILMVCHDGYILVDSFGYLIEKNKISPFDLMSPDNLSLNLKSIGENIRIFGIYGGNGSLINSEGWKLNIIFPSWPNSAVTLRKPYIENNNVEIWEDCKIIGLQEIEYTNLKCGFSFDGTHFLISGSNGIEVFVKN